MLLRIRPCSPKLGDPRPAAMCWAIQVVETTRCNRKWDEKWDSERKHETAWNSTFISRKGHRESLLQTSFFEGCRIDEPVDCEMGEPQTQGRCFNLQTLPWPLPSHPFSPIICLTFLTLPNSAKLCTLFMVELQDEIYVHPNIYHNPRIYMDLCTFPF